MPDQEALAPRALPQHSRIVSLRLDTRSTPLTWLAEDAPDAPTLRDYIAEHGPLKLRDALNIFYQVAGLVTFMHDHGVLHGYILPDTVFCNDRQHCAIGVPARELPAEDRQRLARQHRGFVPPELAEGVVPDSRSDVYSLGALLHWLLVGKPPSGSVSRRLPPALAGYLQQAVERNPASRSQTISALVDALERIPEADLKRYEEELQLAVSAAGFDPRLLWSRHPRKVIACAVMMALIIAGGSWGYREYEERQSSRYEELEEETREQARENSLRRRHDRALEQFDKGDYREALLTYRGLINDDDVNRRREKALAQIARCYGALEDFGSEHGAWIRYMMEYPSGSASGEANERIGRIASLSLMRYGDLVDVTTKQDIMIDGLSNDWTGIEPVAVDPRNDNAKGGPASDLIAFYVAVKDDYIYFRFDTAAPPNEGDQYCVAIDLNAYAYNDSAEEWDYQIGVARGIQPWIWDLTDHRTYNNSKSTPLSGVEFAQKQCVEFKVPLAAIGNPEKPRISVRAFINYAGMRQANDVLRRKVLIQWERQKPQTGITLIDGEQKVGKRE